MVFTSHSVPFPATRDLRSLVAGNGTSWEDKNHFIFLTPVSIHIPFEVSVVSKECASQASGPSVFPIHVAIIWDHFENISTSAKARRAFIVALNSISESKQAQIGKIRALLQKKLFEYQYWKWPYFFHFPNSRPCNGHKGQKGQIAISRPMIG